MEFDKSRVYTAVNAEDLPIGSKCIFADSLYDLRTKVQGKRYKDFISTLKRINNDCYINIFDGGDFSYNLAYLIELPAEPKYKPFESVEKAMEAIKKHGGWVRDRTTDDLKLITSIGKISDSVDSIGVGGSYYTFTTFLDRYVFADDGSHCGELVEE